MPPPEYCRYLIDRYDSAIGYVDHEVGKLLDNLRARGLYDESLIVITSDHGEAFGERRYLSHGMSVYENQVRIPLLIKAPNQNTARVVATPVSSVDVFVTALMVTGGTRPQIMSGTDLTEKTLGARPILTEHFSVTNDGQVAIIENDMKLIRDSNGATPCMILTPILLSSAICHPTHVIAMRRWSCSVLWRGAWRAQNVRRVA